MSTVNYYNENNKSFQNCCKRYKKVCEQIKLLQNKRIPSSSFSVLVGEEQAQVLLLVQTLLIQVLKQAKKEKKYVSKL